jgi:hypothetical protein
VRQRITFLEAGRRRSLLCTEKTAAKRYRCVLCPEPIEAGDVYWIDGNNISRFHAFHLEDGSAVYTDGAPPVEPSDVELLLAGLEVGSVSELRRLVLAARAGVVVTPHQVRAIAAMFAAPEPDRDFPPCLRTIEDVTHLPPGERAVPVRLRHGRLEGAVHAEPIADDDRILRACLFSHDVTREGGNLGISYETLMGLPDEGAKT